MGVVFSIMVVQKIISLCFLLFSVCLGDYGTLQRVSIKTSMCQDCGMTGVGQANLKICGGSNPENCCAIVNIADFDNNMFNEGQTDDYTGSYMLEDCYNFRLSGANAPQDVTVTVYNEGSFDGVQLDYVDVSTELVTLRCPQGVFLSETSSYMSQCFLA